MIWYLALDGKLKYYSFMLSNQIKDEMMKKEERMSHKKYWIMITKAFKSFFSLAFPSNVSRFQHSSSIMRCHSSRRHCQGVWLLKIYCLCFMFISYSNRQKNVSRASRVSESRYIYSNEVNKWFLSYQKPIYSLYSFNSIILLCSALFIQFPSGQKSILVFFPPTSSTPPKTTPLGPG